MLASGSAQTADASSLVRPLTSSVMMIRELSLFTSCKHNKIHENSLTIFHLNILIRFESYRQISRISCEQDSDENLGD